MPKVLLLLAVLLGVLNGCAVATFYPQDGAKTYPPTDPRQVRVYAGSLDDRGTSGISPPPHYEVIGSIAVDKPGDGTDALLLLREKAAQVGANAVIEARLTKATSFQHRTGISGVAVRTD